MRVLRVYWLILFFVGIAGLGIFSGSVEAQLVSDSSEPNIIHDYSMNGTFNPANYAKNTDCEATFQQIFDDSPYSCRVRTAYGHVIDNSRLLRNGTHKPGDITGTSGLLRAIPNSRHMLSLLGNRYVGYNVYLYRNVAGNITTKANATKTYIRHRVDSTPRLLLPDNPSVTNRISSYGVSFSGNSRWMVSQTQGKSIVRININTGDSLYFGEAFADSDRAKPKTAISSDGRYAVLGSGYFEALKLYDLENCTKRDNSIYHDCPHIDLGKLLQENGYGDFAFTEAVRFLSNESVYVQFISGTSMPYTRNNVLVTPHDYEEAKFGYIGLGDSFASGEGAFEYKPETDTSMNSCRVSMRSYPFLLGSQLGIESYDSVACSGAVINDVHYEPMEDYEGQMDGVTQASRPVTEIEMFINNFYAGHINQSSFISEYKPKHITVSAVGNDIGFNDIIKRCLMPGTCYKTEEDRIELTHEIDQKIDELESMYSNLRVSGHTDPHIYAIGYPQIANPAGNCGVNVRLNTDELVFAEGLISYLNKAIEIAAKRAGVVYVDVSDAFVGHKLCDTTSSPAIHGLTAGTDTPDMFGGPAGNQSYHPTAFGHFLLQAKIIEHTESFNKEMPEADPTAWFSSPEPTTELRVSSPNGSTGRELAVTQYGRTITSDYAVRGENISISVDGTAHSLQAGSHYEVWLYSEPTLLGEVEANEHGALETSFELPDELEDGYHTVKVTGENALQQPIVIHKTIYVSSIDYAEELASTDEDEVCVFEELFTDMCEEEPMPPSDFQPDNPKPPINNPETEAGAEQPNEQHGTGENEGTPVTNRANLEDTSQSSQATLTATVKVAEMSDDDTQSVADATDINKDIQNGKVLANASDAESTTKSFWYATTMVVVTATILAGLFFVVYARSQEDKQA